MNAGLIYNLTASCLLIVAGIPSSRRHEYSDPIGLKEMYNESLNLLAFPPLAALSTVSLWWNTSGIILFGILLLCLTAARYVCRFHPAIKGDEHERRGYQRYWKRNVFIPHN